MNTNINNFSKIRNTQQNNPESKTRVKTLLDYFSASRKISTRNTFQSKNLVFLSSGTQSATLQYVYIVNFETLLYRIVQSQTADRKKLQKNPHVRENWRDVKVTYRKHRKTDKQNCPPPTHNYESRHYIICFIPVYTYHSEERTLSHLS